MCAIKPFFLYKRFRNGHNRFTLRILQHGSVCIEMLIKKQKRKKKKPLTFLFCMFLCVLNNSKKHCSSHRVKQASDVPIFQPGHQNHSDLDSIFTVCKTTSGLHNHVPVAPFVSTDSDCVQYGFDLFCIYILWCDLFQLLEDEIVVFVKNELTRMKNSLNPEFSELSESPNEDEEQRSRREAFLKLTVHFLNKMNQKDLAACLLSSKRIPFHKCILKKF